MKMKRSDQERVAREKVQAIRRRAGKPAHAVEHMTMESE